jgi:hypothetical protein
MKKIVILMSDNRDQFSGDYNTLTAKINSTYAAKWDYDFIYLKTDECYSPSGQLRHPAWSKLNSTKKIIEKYKYDLIVYIDSDCIFSNHQISIEEYLKSAKNIKNESIELKSVIFLNDFPFGYDLPCSGFYIVNTKDTTIFDDWFNCDDFPHFNLNHSWEQHILHNYILQKWSNKIEVIDDVMFLEKENQFLRHVASHESNNRVSYFENYIKNL